ncbi:MAG: hypothetical protein R3Y09_07165 [Clostridia bacterium]
MNITYIKNESLNSYKGIAFDGTNFYASTNFFIYKLDKNMHILSKTQTFREYNQLCFDNIDNCFYAISDSSPHKIFKLDYELNEVDFILLQNYVRSICFCENKIFYATADSIFLINKHSDTVLVKKFNTKMPISIFFTQNNFSVCSLLHNQYLLEIFDKNGMLKLKLQIPKSYTPTQILSENQVLISKSGIYSYLLYDF